MVKKLNPNLVDIANHLDFDNPNILYDEYDIGHSEENNIDVIIHMSLGDKHWITIRINSQEVVTDQKINTYELMHPDESSLFLNNDYINAHYRIIKVLYQIPNSIDVEFNDTNMWYIHNHRDRYKFYLINPYTLKVDKLNAIIAYHIEDYSYTLKDEELTAFKFLMNNYDKYKHCFYDQILENKYHNKYENTINKIINKAFTNFDYTYDDIEIYKLIQHNIVGNITCEAIIPHGTITDNIKDYKTLTVKYSINGINGIWVESTLDI